MLIDDYINYHNIYSKKYGNKTVVLMQVGSFFECYAIENEKQKFNSENLYNICDICNIQSSRKNKNIIETSRSNPIMAGISTLAIDKFIQILLNNMFTIILIEQVTEPPEPERKVTNIYSPGTNIQYINGDDTPNLISIYIENIKDIKNYKDIIAVGLSVIDLTTGKSVLYETYSEKEDNYKAYDEIYRFIQTHNPKEIIINVKSSSLKKEELITYLEINSRNYHYISDEHIDKNILKLSYQRTFLEKVFKNLNKSFLTIHEFLDLENKIYGTISYISLLQFAYEHNENIIQKIEKPKIWESNNYLILTNDSINQLNLIDYSPNSGKYDSLFGILNNTSTTLGKRYLKDKLLNPINNVETLEKRYSYIEELLLKNSNSVYYYKEIETYLNKICDIERLHRKMSLKMLQPADFSMLDISYRNILNILDNIEVFSIESRNINQLLPNKQNLDLFREFINEYTELFDLNEIMKYHLNNISNSFFNKNQIEELDTLQDTIKEYRNILLTIANKLSYYIEKGSEYVKLEFTDKDGYYLLTTKKRGESIKNSFKNMGYKKIKIKEIDLELDPNKLEIKFLKNSCKITSDYLNSISYKMRLKEEEIKSKTTEYYLKYLEIFYSKYSESLKEIANFIAKIDFYKSNAKSSIMYGYYKPNLHFKNQNDAMNNNSFILAKEMRHPIIEKIQTSVEYVPNDISIGSINENVNEIKKPNGILLYGCNAVGKSSLMKAIGLNIIMAQTGMFVPCNEFHYNPFNYIFTRINDNDNLFKGQSSFAVEMSELRGILKRSDNKSMILGDELCSGTESVSAQSIFAASVIKLSERNVNFIFATHLHELYKRKDIQSLNNVKSYHLKVIFDPQTKKLIYDRKLEEGNGPTIYGLEVCKAMDLDEDFLKLANKIRQEILEVDEKILSDHKSQYNSDLYVDLCKVCNEKATETHHIKEQHEADENKMIGNIPKDNLSNLVPLCNECHLKVHHNNLLIRGYINTSEGIKLDYEYITQKEVNNKKNNRKKYSEFQVKQILNYKNKQLSMNRTIIQLNEKEGIKISQQTLKKIWQGDY